MASKYLQKYPVPIGFQEILADFAREVLRDQPTNIIEYAAKYFETLEKGEKFSFDSKYNVSKDSKNYELAYNPKNAQQITKKASNIAQSFEREDAQTPAVQTHQRQDSASAAYSIQRDDDNAPADQSIERSDDYAPATQSYQNNNNNVPVQQQDHIPVKNRNDAFEANEEQVSVAKEYENYVKKADDAPVAQEDDTPIENENNKSEAKQEEAFVATQDNNLAQREQETSGVKQDDYPTAKQETSGVKQDDHPTAKQEEETPAASQKTVNAQQVQSYVQSQGQNIINQQVEEMIDQLYSQFDKNQNGYLETGELTDFIQYTLHRYGQMREPSESEISEFKQICDTNHDGKISKQEFRNFIYKFN